MTASFSQELERQESEIESSSNSELDAEVQSDKQSLSNRLNHLLSESEEKIDSAKKVGCFSCFSSENND